MITKLAGGTSSAPGTSGVVPTEEDLEYVFDNDLYSVA